MLPHTRKLLGATVLLVFGSVFASVPADASCPTGRAGHLQSSLNVPPDPQYSGAYMFDAMWYGDPFEARAVLWDFAVIPFEFGSSFDLLNGDHSSRVRLGFDGGTVSLNGSATGLPYAAEAWNSIELSLDVTAQTATLSVNGVTTPPTAVAFSGGTVSGLHISTGHPESADAAWLDEMTLRAVSTSGERRVLVHESFENAFYGNIGNGGFAISEPPTRDLVEGDLDCTVELSLKQTQTSERIYASGKLHPAEAGAERDVTLKLFARRDGEFVRVASKTVTPTDLGKYRASFRQPKTRSCRLKAIYPGAPDWERASVARTFPC